MKNSVLIALVAGCLTVIINLMGVLLSSQKLGQVTGRQAQVWEVPEEPKNTNTIIPNYESLLSRNFQLLPKRLREKLLGKSEQVTPPKIEEEKVDKTLKPNFKVFDDEHQIGLVGVFFEQTAFVVFQKVNFKSQMVSYHKIKMNERIGPYTLVNVEPNKVMLSVEDRTLELKLFKAGE